MWWKECLRTYYTPQSPVDGHLLPLLRATVGIVPFIITLVTRYETDIILVRAGKAILIHLSWALISIMSLVLTFVANYVA